MENESLRARYERIVGELPRLLPVGYLLMVVVGMVFNYFKYDAFGINIFQYASVFDFLISPFEDMAILLFIFGSLLLVVFTIAVDYGWKKRYPRSYRKCTFRWMETGWYKSLSYVLVLGVYVIYAAMFYGSYTYHRVRAKQDVSVRYMDNEQLCGKQIGKVGTTLFLLCGDEVKLIPTNTFKSVSFRLED